MCAPPFIKSYRPPCLPAASSNMHTGKIFQILYDRYLVYLDIIKMILTLQFESIPTLN